jgi:hypothetical protein
MDEEKQKAEIHLQEKIKVLNTKIIRYAAIISAVIAVTTYICSPFCDPFFGLFAALILITVIGVNVFCISYQALFYYFDKDLIVEAKKRGKYVTYPKPYYVEVHIKHDSEEVLK